MSEMAEPTLPCTCPECGQRNELPTDAPEPGHRLLCSHCGSALVAMSPEAAGAPVDTLWRLFHYADRCLLNPRCPHCGAFNRAVLAPANCRFGGETLAAPARQHPFYRLDLICSSCGEGFCMEWE